MPSALTKYQVWIEIDGRRIGWIKVEAESRDHAAGQAISAWRRYYGGLWPKDKMKVETIRSLREGVTEPEPTEVK